MRVETTEKTQGLFDRLMDINTHCFTGVELPPENVLRYQYDFAEVFIHKNSDGRIVGYALVSGRISKPYLFSLAVVPGYRRLGIATQLLQEIIRYYQGKNDFIELTVNINNPAQKLYFDQGFRALQVIPKYYGEISGLRMRREL